MRAQTEAILNVANSIDGAQIVNALNLKLATYIGWVGEPSPTYVAPPSGAKLVNALITFLTAADADKFYGEIVVEWTTGANAPKILAGSLVKRINTFYDEGLGQADYTPYELTK